MMLDDALVAEIDRVAGARGRSAFIAKAIDKALEEERRWTGILDSLGSIADTGHEWDEDPAAWVRAQRRADPRAVG
jgi:predicted transcriptional regulator